MNPKGLDGSVENLLVLFRSSSIGAFPKASRRYLISPMDHPTDRACQPTM